MIGWLCIGLLSRIVLERNELGFGIFLLVNALLHYCILWLCWNLRTE